MVGYDNFDHFKKIKPKTARSLEIKALSACANQIVRMSGNIHDTFVSVLMLKNNNNIGQGYSVTYKSYGLSGFKILGVIKYESQEEWLDAFNEVKIKTNNIVWA